MAYRVLVDFTNLPTDIVGKVLSFLSDDYVDVVRRKAYVIDEIDDMQRTLSFMPMAGRYSPVHWRPRFSFDAYLYAVGIHMVKHYCDGFQFVYNEHYDDRDLLVELYDNITSEVCRYNLMRENKKYII